MKDVPGTMEQTCELEECQQLISSGLEAYIGGNPRLCGTQHCTDGIYEEKDRHISTETFIQQNGL
jgi:hypothetical protein